MRQLSNNELLYLYLTLWHWSMAMTLTIREDLSQLSVQDFSSPPLSAELLQRARNVRVRELFDEHTFSEEGISLFYRETVPPPGVPKRGSVLLLHGAVYSSRTWSHRVGQPGPTTMQILAAAGYRTIAIDLPGYPRRTTGQLRRSARSFLADLVTALNLQQPAIISPSASGAFSLDFVTTYAHAVGAFIPIAPCCPNANQYWQHLNVPLLIVRGSDDGTPNKELLRTQHHNVFIVPGAGHAAYLHQPHAFHTAVVNFLDYVYSNGSMVIEEHSTTNRTKLKDFRQLITANDLDVASVTRTTRTHHITIGILPGITASGDRLASGRTLSGLTTRSFRSPITDGNHRQVTMTTQPPPTSPQNRITVELQSIERSTIGPPAFVPPSASASVVGAGKESFQPLAISPQPVAAVSIHPQEDDRNLARSPSNRPPITSARPRPVVSNRPFRPVSVRPQPHSDHQLQPISVGPPAPIEPETSATTKTTFSTFPPSTARMSTMTTRNEGDQLSFTTLVRRFHHGLPNATAAPSTTKSALQTKKPSTIVPVDHRQHRSNTDDKRRLDFRTVDLTRQLVSAVDQNRAANIDIRFDTTPIAATRHELHFAEVQPPADASPLGTFVFTPETFGSAVWDRALQTISLLGYRALTFEWPLDCSDVTCLMSVLSGLNASQPILVCPPSGCEQAFGWVKLLAVMQPDYLSAFVSVSSAVLPPLVETVFGDRYFKTNELLTVLVNGRQDVAAEQRAIQVRKMPQAQVVSIPGVRDMPHRYARVEFHNVLANLADYVYGDQT